jgi:gliding motility-associated-like protein
VVEEELVYHIPNAFTPNGEGVPANEYFMPVFYSGYDPNFLEFYILNRWGDELFFTDQFGVGWDGTFRGSNQTTGAYLYKIRFKRKKDGKLIEHINTFLLIE